MLELYLDININHPKQRNKIIVGSPYGGRCKLVTTCLSYETNWATYSSAYKTIELRKVRVC